VTGAIVPFVPGLRNYQREAVDFLAASCRAIIALPPGTGKTATVSSWLGGLDTPLRVLIVAPNGPVLQHWADELHRWGGIAAVVGTGTPAKRKLARLGVVADGGAIVVNYECMRGDIDELLKIEWGAVVFDESHRLKNRKALVLKAAAKLARRTPRLALVTGTPLLNSADELWTSLHMMDPKRYASFWRWATVLFDIEMPRHRGRIVREVKGMKPGAAPVIRQQLAAYLVKRPLKELMPELPPVTETYLHVQLSPPERRMYDSMRSRFWMEHGGEVFEAPYKITQSLRLRQLSSDWSAFTQVLRDVAPAQLGAKGLAAVDLVNDLAPDQVLVLCAFRHTADAIVIALDGQAVAYHGGIGSIARGATIKAFTSGAARVLVGTIGTLGEGVDGLQVARHLVMVDRDWTPARNEQAIARLARSGQRSAVNVTHLVADDTYDAVVSAALRRKESVVSAILGTRP